MSQTSEKETRRVPVVKLSFLRLSAPTCRFHCWEKDTQIPNVENHKTFIELADAGLLGRLTMDEVDSLFCPVLPPV